MKEITINSFEELQDLVFATCWDEKTMRYRNNFVYRGVPDKNYDLSSKLSRICRHDLSLEASIIRSFKKYGYTDVKDCSSFWQILAMGQHYGLPTRLLDWTYSPLVAAHFATENIYMYDHDGAIYCMDLKEGERHLPLCLKKELAASCAQSFTMAMLQRHAENLEELEALSENAFFLFYEPASQSNRMSNQYALFSICSKKEYSITDLIDMEDTTLYKIIIPKTVKLEIRDKLDYINISERLIYPGLDGICSWITRRYADLGRRYNQKRNKGDICK